MTIGRGGRYARHHEDLDEIPHRGLARSRPRSGDTSRRREPSKRDELPLRPIHPDRTLCPRTPRALLRSRGRLRAERGQGVLEKPVANDISPSRGGGGAQPGRRRRRGGRQARAHSPRGGRGSIRKAGGHQGPPHGGLPREPFRGPGLGAVPSADLCPRPPPRPGIQPRPIGHQARRPPFRLAVAGLLSDQFILRRIPRRPHHRDSGAQRPRTQGRPEDGRLPTLARHRRHRGPRRGARRACREPFGSSEAKRTPTASSTPSWLPRSPPWSRATSIFPWARS